MAFKRWAWSGICLCAMLLAACGVTSTTNSAGNSGTSTTTTVSTTPTATPVIYATPTPGNGSVLHAAIASIQMVDAENGWGLTNGENAQRAPQQLIHTTDGGHTWADVTPPGFHNDSGDLLILDAQSVTSAWAAASGVPDGSHPSPLWHSTNSGATWQTFTIATSAIGESDFVDAQHGWIVSEPGGGSAGPTYFDLWQTTNGGATWQNIPQSPFGFGVAITFVTTSVGFGVTGISNSPPEFLRTQNGGRTWSFITLSVPNLGSPIVFSQSEAPVFSSATDGSMGVIYQTNTQYYLAVYLTHDGGATWQFSVVEKGHCIPSLHGANALFVACAQTYTSPISLYHLVGTSWQTVSIASGSQANLVDLIPDGELDMISAGTGWAIANAGLSQTTDGGHTWTLLVPATFVPGS
jgi:photosystem II stability/assembly factor-like uncharacterized protein